VTQRAYAAMSGRLLKDTYRYLQILTDTYRYLQILTDTYGAVGAGPRLHVGCGQRCEAAAGGGHLDVLRWAREHECPWDENTVWRARSV